MIVEANYPTINNIIDAMQFAKKPMMKLLAGSSIQVICHASEDKAKLIEKLKLEKFKFFTYAEPHQKPASYVLKGVDTIFSPDEILASLKAKELPVVKVSFLVNKPNMVFHLVQFERGQLNINSLRHQAPHIENLIVKWEKLKRTAKRPTQCHRCQQFGHAASHCGREYKCVKCTEQHEPGQCNRTSKDAEGSPRCVNCQGEHTANTTSCPSYIKYVQKISSHRQNRQAAASSSSSVSKSTTAPQASLGPAATLLTNSSVTYAQTVRMNLNGSGSSANNSPSLSGLQQRLLAIPNINSTLSAFRKLIEELESAQNESARRLALVSFPENV